ncbi:MAG: (2Fe-2S)-binding protein [Ekhidna sp.]|nr:(2Fe-2S)-binding protein [Ekhidna sp.]MBC6410351.1 (2Fe-2S)-binding protein [Ekhidna sp.]MBC6425604.1 (2Fe-2S)-binding protein [Ekhidna sp.]
MIKIVITNLQSKIIQNNEKKESLLNILLKETDWMHACGGKGKCTTCKARVLEGAENVTPYTPVEKQYLKQNKLQENERLACQVALKGNVVLEVPKGTQLPHLSYD